MEKAIYDYKDLGLASYLIVNGNEFKGINVRYSKRFNEIKTYITIEGNKENLIAMKKYYEENKLTILKSKSINEEIDRLVNCIKLKEI